MKKVLIIFIVIIFSGLTLIGCGSNQPTNIKECNCTEKEILIAETKIINITKENYKIYLIVMQEAVKDNYGIKYCITFNGKDINYEYDVTVDAYAYGIGTSNKITKLDKNGIGRTALNEKPYDITEIYGTVKITVVRGV